MKKKLNILTISMGAGGAEKVISLLLNRLVEDYRVTLILFSKEIHFNIPKDVKVIFLSTESTQSFLSKLASPFGLIPKYEAILKTTKPDISLSFLTRANFLNSLVKAKGTKVILSERCYPSIAYRSSPFRYKLYKVLIPILYNKADCVFSNSKFINEDLRINFGVKVPLTVIYNPVEIAQTSDFSSTNKVIDIIWVGKLNAIKNPKLLVQALHNSPRNLHTTFLGEGNLDVALKSMSDGLNTAFEGKVTNVADYLIQSKVFVLTSNSEGFPNAILEAMSHGLPIIATDCKSGPLELLNEGEGVNIGRGTYQVVKYGILINVDDSDAPSLALTHLFNNSMLRNHLAKMSLKRSKDYSVSKIYAQLKSLL